MEMGKNRGKGRRKEDLYLIATRVARGCWPFREGMHVDPKEEKKTEK